MTFWDLHRGKIITGGIICLILVGLIYGFFIKKSDDDYVPLPSYAASSTGDNDSTSNGLAETETELIVEEKIVVDVKGAVKSPGIYELTVNQRVHEAIAAAGGTTDEADTDQINLAAFLNDGQVVYVPKIGEEENDWAEQTHNNTGTGSQKVNINRATVDELTTLPGIGPAKADAIIQYRTEKGGFKNVEELIEVSGIGQKTLEKLLPHVTIK